MRSVLPVCTLVLCLLAAPAAVQAGPFLWAPSIGSNLNLTDNSVTSVNFGFTFPFLGSNYTSGEVSSNGFISLGGSNGDGCCSGSVTALLSGHPRIALAWYDHLPGGGNNVYYQAFGDHAVITWNNVRSFDSANVVALIQMQLWQSGMVVLAYDQLANNGLAPPNGLNDQVLLGLSPGGGAADPGPLGGFPLNTGTVGTLYYLFNVGGNSQVWELTDYTVTLTPNGQGGWIGADYEGQAIPEPTTFWLMGLGIALVAGRSWLRRR